MCSFLAVRQVEDQGMALKKSQIYSSLWQSCDELRGGMDASQYKDYILTLLFMKYVSDKYAGKPDALIEVPGGGGFADMAKLKGDKEIGDKINKIIGLLAGANDQCKVTKVGAKARLRSIRKEPDAEEERTALTRCLALLEAESKAGKAVKEAQKALDEQVLARYATLTETEIKTLVVEDKWLKNIRAAIEDEVQRLTQQLAGRVKELEERYARPLPELEREVEAFGDKVAGHLKRMGVPL